MNRKSLGLLVVPLLLAAGVGAESRETIHVTAETRALEAVTTAERHRTVGQGELMTSFHPGWISRIQVIDAQGNREELYQQAEAYKGKKPKELALTFRDSALVVIDPEAQISSITVHLTGGEVWTFEDQVLQCPPSCSGLK